MNTSVKSIEERIDRFHNHGLVDLHFDMPMELYEKRDQSNLLRNEFLPQLKAGGIGVVGAAIYIEDRYLPELALRVALDQIARLYQEAEQAEQIAICKSYQEIVAARAAGKIAVLITMEGVEPFGMDLNLVRVFYELGVRAIGLTHARPNPAGNGGIFARSGSPPGGVTPFGRDVIRECEHLGIMVDLAHINPAGFDDILSCTTKPVIVSHTNVRKYYDIERNVNDAQIKMVGERGGVIGINAILVSPRAEKSTLDHYIDHIEHVVKLIGAEGVAIGFDFFEFLYRQWPEDKKQELATKFTTPHFIPNLTNHSHARNLTRKLIERGFSDEEIEKILYRNWMRMFEQLL